MTKKKQVTKRDLYEVISEATGADVLPVVKYLKTRKNISEFQIAEGINFKVNHIRSILYRLQTKNLVTYYRKKDKIKGWYISYWSFNPEGAAYLEVTLKNNKLSELKERLSKEEKYEGLFYICPNFCSRLEFEKATEVNFKCPECGEVLKHQDNTRTIEMLKTKIEELSKE